MTLPLSKASEILILWKVKHLISKMPIFYILWWIKKALLLESNPNKYLQSEGLKGGIYLRKAFYLAWTQEQATGGLWATEVQAAREIAASQICPFSHPDSWIQCWSQKSGNNMEKHFPEIFICNSLPEIDWVTSLIEYIKKGKIALLKFLYHTVAHGRPVIFNLNSELLVTSQNAL